MDLLNLCLTSTYFQYNGKHYKQLQGTAMGSSVSVVVAEIVMQNVEEQVLATYTRTVPLWLRYVDDTFTAVHKDRIDDFHEHLNRQNAILQFTKEIEENGKIPFLDCLVTRDNNKLKTPIYRKPTHTDRQKIQLLKKLNQDYDQELKKATKSKNLHMFKTIITYILYVKNTEIECVCLSARLLIRPFKKVCFNPLLKLPKDEEKLISRGREFHKKR